MSKTTSQLPAVSVGLPPKRTAAIDTHKSADALPAYVFQATILVGSLTRSTYLSALEAKLKDADPSWSRQSAQVFEKIVPVADADLGAVEEQVLAKMQEVLDETVPPLVGYVKASFNSSGVIVQSR